MKGYVMYYESRESANHEIIDYWFSDSPKDALKLPTREWATLEAARFGRGITINQDIQRPHTLTDFQVEEFGDEFVVWCEGPFVLRARGEVAVRNRAVDKPDTPSGLLM